MMHDHPAEGVNPIYTRGSTNNLLYDLTKLRSMVEGDEVMVLKMLRMFLEKTPLLIDEMKKFYEESSFNEVSKLAHKLKTSIILMGIVRLQNNVKLIEKYATEPAHFEELPALLEELENICGLVFEQMQEEFLLNK
jgi:HPt (histidine-containing phosphotransfer) domain-containing protein